MLLLKRKLFAVVILVLGVILVVGCSNNKISGHDGTTEANGPINKEKAQEIALNDVPNFKPNNRNFEIYSVERKEMGYRNSKEAIY